MPGFFGSAVLGTGETDRNRTVRGSTTRRRPRPRNLMLTADAIAATAMLPKTGFIVA